MNIVVIGAGDIGFQLTKRLTSDRHNLTVVEHDVQRARRASEQLDAMVIEGHGASYATLQKARIESAEIVAAMTNSDEVNLLACQISKKIGVPTTIARVRDPQYNLKDFILSRTELGVDLIIHPEQETADSVIRLLRQSMATDVIEFAGGKCQLLGMRLEKNSPLLGQTLRELSEAHGNIPQRIVAINRKQRTIIPGGDAKLYPGDQIFVVCDPDYIPDIINISGKTKAQIDNVMILGGGLIGRFVASSLAKEVNSKIIESSTEKSLEIADILPNSLIIHGDGTDVDLLAAEGLMDMDAFVAVTGDDETNIISTLVARHLEVPRTIALVNNLDYLPITSTIGMDAVVSKQLITVNAVQRFIRHQIVASIASLPEVDAEIIEFVAHPNSRIVQKPLKSIHFPKHSIVGAVLRNGKFIVPTGETHIQPDDQVIVFTLPQSQAGVEKLFHESGGFFR